MSGLSLAAHPRLAGAGRHTAQTKGCLRAPCVLVLRARLWGFALLRFMPGCCPTVLRSHILLAHALWRGRFVFARVGQHLLWACLLGGWLSFVFTRGACSPFGVCVLACVRSLGGGGTVWSRRPLPRLACLRAHALAWALLACAVVLRARWAEGGQVGAGQRCPAPYCVALGCFGRPVARGERKRGCSRCANTRAHT